MCGDHTSCKILNLYGNWYCIVINSLGMSPTRKWLIYLCLLPMLYNPILAIVNAHVMPLSFIYAAVSETLILFTVLLYVFRRGVEVTQKAAILLIVIALYSMALSWLASGFLYVDFLRNMLIVCCFTLLGKQLRLSEIIHIYKFCLFLTLFFLVIELVDLHFFVSIFEPAYYYQNTRGVEAREYNDIGVFHNALRLEGRFNYGLFSGPRSTSLFLDQVTLSNMTIVIAILTSVLSSVLNRVWKFIAIFFICLSLLATESRTSLGVVTVVFLGHYYFPRVPKVVTLFIVPLVVLAGSAYAEFNPVYTGDTLTGRMSLGFGHLNNLDIIDYFGGGASRVGELFDAGYAYVICSGTIFGALYFYKYLISLYRVDDVFNRRLFTGLFLFISLSLCVAGTAIFSMKMAFLYWLTCGYFSQASYRSGSSINSHADLH